MVPVYGFVRVDLAVVLVHQPPKSFIWVTQRTKQLIKTTPLCGKSVQTQGNTFLLFGFKRRNIFLYLHFQQYFLVARPLRGGGGGVRAWPLKKELF